MQGHVHAGRRRVFDSRPPEGAAAHVRHRGGRVRAVARVRAQRGDVDVRLAAGEVHELGPRHEPQQPRRGHHRPQPGKDGLARDGALVEAALDGQVGVPAARGEGDVGGGAVLEELDARAVREHRLEGLKEEVPEGVLVDPLVLDVLEPHQ